MNIAASHPADTYEGFLVGPRCQHIKYLSCKETTDEGSVKTNNYHTNEEQTPNIRGLLWMIDPITNPNRYKHPP